METGRKISLLLIMLSLILALLPLTSNRSFTGEPHNLLAGVLSEEASLSVDQVAGYIVTEDSTIQLIDLRAPEEFRKQTIPGAVNVQYKDLISKDPDIWLGDKDIKSIFYSDSDAEQSFALVYARGLGYDNVFVMDGGIGEWMETVLETKFTGERITARENALFETRRRAGEMFTTLNNLPDSLKALFLESRKFSAKKLDGGCE
ncbi:MAG: rhodanese-like domain-containing protein [Bacteroidales bacterium]